jgi:hypothetical protein
VRRFEPALLLAWTMLTAALCFGDFDNVVRIGLAISFVGAVPGLALGRLFGLDREMRWLTAIPLSLAVDAIVSGALVYLGVASWDLALSILISLAVAALIVDISPPELDLGRMLDLPVPGKLDDEARQARLVEELLAGGSLAEAAEAAGVSVRTLQRSLRRSAALRRAVEVASHRDEAAIALTGSNAIEEESG